MSEKHPHLSDQAQNFLSLLLGNGWSFEPVAAARDAGYERPEASARALLKTPEVADAIREHLEKYGVSPEQTIMGIANIAYGMMNEPRDRLAALKQLAKYLDLPGYVKQMALTRDFVEKAADSPPEPTVRTGRDRPPSSLNVPSTPGTKPIAGRIQLGKVVG